MNRSQMLRQAIGESVEMSEDRVNCSVAHQELVNWGAWIRSIRTPIPCPSAKGILLFRELKPMYPEEPRVRLEPDLVRAEICETLICEHCQPVEITCFYATYALQLTNERAAEIMDEDHKKRHKQRSRKRVYSKEKYAALLNSSVNGLSKVYQIIEK